MRSSSWPIITLTTVGLAILVARLIPDPERTANTLLDDGYFTVSPELGPLNKFKISTTASATGGAYHEILEKTTGDCGVGDISGCDNTKCAPPYHLHTRQNETFKIISGVAQFVADGKLQTATEGETVFIPSGMRHTFCRDPSLDPADDLIVRFRLEPALNSEAFFPNFIGIFNNNAMKPSPVQLIWLLCEHHIRLANIPGPIHEIMCMSVSVIGPLLGYRLHYDEYMRVLSLSPHGGLMGDEL